MLFKGIMTSASGSTGGITASRNRGGMYFRGRSVPTNPNTNRQQAVRAAMATLATTWGLLTQAQRDAWNAYGAATEVLGPLGDPVPLTGQQAFIRGNVPRLQAGDALVSAGPATPGLPTLSTLGAITISVASGLSIAYTNTDSWAGTVGGHLYAYLSPTRSAGVQFSPGRYRLAGSEDGASEPPTSPLVVATANLPWAPTAGLAMWVRVTASDATGRLSAEQVRRIIVTA